MSPIGGVGVNLAVQDAVAAANILWQPLAAGTLREDDLDRVQERREFPTRVTQRMQVFMQNKVIDRALGAGKAIEAPLAAAADRAVRAAAPHSRAPRRHGRAAGARAHAGYPRCGAQAARALQSAKSSGLSSIGVPCGVRSAARSQASR